MLDLMRRKKRLKLILWLVILSLSLGMLLFFVPGQNLGIQGFDSSAASVAGETISMQELHDTYERIRENYSAGGKNKTDPETMKRLGVDRQALNALIQMRVVSYCAKRLGLDVTPDEVRQSIEWNPNLRDGNGFIGLEAYKAVLAANRVDVGQFEEGVRYSLLAKKVVNLLSDSLTIPEQQLREDFARQNQEAQVQYALFDKEAAKKRISPTETELRAHFEKDKDKYHIKEERRAQYLLLPIDGVASTIKVTDREVDDEWAKTEHPETVTASHILFRVDDPSKDAEAKAKAEEVLKRAQAGADFAELAKKSSEDESSAPQGGKLSPFPRGLMDKTFEDAAFALKPGKISGLVRSAYGYHIIKVLANDIPNKETSRPSLTRDIQVEKASEIVKKRVAEAQKMGETQKDLATIAKAANIPTEIKETGFLNQSSDAFTNGVSQEFLDELFRLKEINSVGKAVEVPSGYALPKLLQINLPRPAEFKEVQETVRKDYIEAKASELLEAQAKKLSDEAKKLGDLTKAAEKDGVPVKASSSFKRDGTPAKEIGSAPDFTAAAFKLPVGGISDPITIAGGKQIAVLQVKSLTPFNEAEYAKQKPQLREQALAMAREVYLEEYISRVTDSLQKAGKIRVNKQALDLVSGYRY
jgi:peptidyl-prolyl cis-trans isomerase D